MFGTQLSILETIIMRISQANAYEVHSIMSGMQQTLKKLSGIIRKERF